jgi:hypothetical protein
VIQISWLKPFEKLGEGRKFVVKYTVTKPVTGLNFSVPDQTYPQRPLFAITGLFRFQQLKQIEALTNSRLTNQIENRELIFFKQINNLLEKRHFFSKQISDYCLFERLNIHR